MFQCSSASRKFLNVCRDGRAAGGAGFQCSSASRKFLNLVRAPAVPTLRRVSVLFSEPKIPQSYSTVVDVIELLAFQCSSASRKFLNFERIPLFVLVFGFSALQRAENSSTRAARRPRHADRRRFSALQRAENSSTTFVSQTQEYPHRVSVLFSEPKIPQRIASTGVAPSP